jgi:hypothetical protein
VRARGEVERRGEHSHGPQPSSLIHLIMLLALSPAPAAAPGIRFRILPGLRRRPSGELQAASAAAGASAWASAWAGAWAEGALDSAAGVRPQLAPQDGPGELHQERGQGELSCVFRQTCHREWRRGAREKGRGRASERSRPTLPRSSPSLPRRCPLRSRTSYPS